MLNTVKAVQNTLEKSGNQIELLYESYPFTSETEAFLTLKATLWALRDRLPTNDAIQLGSQLPSLLRGFYYEAWDPGYQTISRTKEEFISEVKTYIQGDVGTNLLKAVSATLNIIREMIDENIANHFINQLPNEIQELCPD